MGWGGEEALQLPTTGRGEEGQGRRRRQDPATTFLRKPHDGGALGPLFQLDYGTAGPM